MIFSVLRVTKGKRENSSVCIPVRETVYLEPIGSPA
jgi:hypothetical protein